MARFRARRAASLGVKAARISRVSAVATSLFSVSTSRSGLSNALAQTVRSPAAWMSRAPIRIRPPALATDPSTTASTDNSFAICWSGLRAPL